LESKHTHTVMQLWCCQLWKWSWITSFCC